MIGLGIISALASAIGFLDHYAEDDAPSASGATSTMLTPASDSDVASAETTVAAAMVTSSTSAPTETTEISTTEAVTSSTINHDAEATAFFDLWSDAVEDGNVDLLVQRLHPAVIERYGAEQCRVYLQAVTEQPIELRVAGVDGPLTGEYARDGLTTIIEDLLLTVVERRDLNAAEVTEEQTRLAYVDGELRWFTDCGEPLEETS